jgi:hypothetical protein
MCYDAAFTEDAYILSHWGLLLPLILSHIVGDRCNQYTYFAATWRENN